MAPAGGGSEGSGSLVVRHIPSAILAYVHEQAVRDIELEILWPAFWPDSRSTEVPTDFIAVKRRQDRAIEIEEHDCFRRSDHHTSFGWVSQVDIVSAYRLSHDRTDHCNRGDFRSNLVLISVRGASGACPRGGRAESLPQAPSRSTRSPTASA